MKAAPKLSTAVTVMVATLLASCGGGTTVEGEVSYPLHGTHCRDLYSKKGTEVTLENGAGILLGAAELQPGRTTTEVGEGKWCAYPFSMSEVNVDGDIFKLTVGGSFMGGHITLSPEELEEPIRMRLSS